MWETVDPDGRWVVLTEQRWLHIAGRHRELCAEPEVGSTLSLRRDRHVAGRETGEEWFYRCGAGPSLLDQGGRTL